MASIPKPVRDLVEAFERLPGIGPKTAQRLTYYLLHAPREEAKALSEAAVALKDKTVICSTCFNISETDPCEFDTEAGRDQTVIAVVEDPLDVLALERANFKGLYHVLHGSISPLENIGPEELHIRELLPRLKDETVLEVILATNPTMEGDATAMYIERLIKPLGVKTTRIARGLPVGGDLEYADETTLSRALEGRKEYWYSKNMPGGPAKTLSSIPKVVIEGMVKPVADQFGQAIEQGVNDTFGTSILPPKAPPKPVQQNPAQKMDEDRRRQNILRYFDTLKANSQTYRQQQEEALNMRRNQELEKKQKIQQFQFEKKQKKQESVEVYRQQRKTEMKVKTG